MKFFPSIEKVRFVNSGTEAVMSAVRLARGFTGRDKVIKFQGCYHGHSDHLLVAAGSGATTFGAPDSPGVPADSARNTLNLPFNDLGAVRRAVESEEGKIACILLEPVAGNMGLVLPAEGFLEGLRSLATAHGILLIFDEVMTGFRVAPGGAQALYAVTPDLTTLGKVMGGGMPIGAYGGRADIMSRISPEGPVYQAGTLSGNPVSVAAGLATLRELSKPGVFKRAGARARQLSEGVADLLGKKGLGYRSYRAGTMFGLFFTPCEVRNYDDAKQSDTRAFARFHASLLSQGVYLAPSQFEAGFLSSAHSESDVEATLNAFSRAL